MMDRPVRQDTLDVLRGSDASFPQFHVNTGIMEYFLDTKGGNLDHLSLVAFYRREIKCERGSFNAEALKFLHVRVGFAARQKGLGGNTALMGTGASPSVFFDDGYFRPHFGCVFRGGKTAWTCTNYNKIICIRHFQAPPV
jgi:hypothetical protein